MTPYTTGTTHTHTPSQSQDGANYPTQRDTKTFYAQFSAEFMPSRTPWFLCRHSPQPRKIPCPKDLLRKKGFQARAGIYLFGSLTHGWKMSSPETCMFIAGLSVFTMFRFQEDHAHINQATFSSGS